MILISSRTDDGSTNRVIDWLVYFEKKFFRINGDSDQVRMRFIENDILTIEVDGEILDLSTITSYWYRRRGIGHRSFEYKLKHELLSNIFFEENDNYFIYDHIRKEFETLIDFIYYILENKNIPKIGSYFKRNLNKLSVLSESKAVGIKSPNSYVCSKSEDFAKIQDIKLITKSLSDGIYRIGKNYEYYSYTENVASEDISSQFLPSLFQEKVNKKFELRIFYLKKKLYATAIFSQQRKDTETDFRKTNSNKPIRFIPYILPDEIIFKISNLMSRLNLDIGAIDMLVDDNNDYIFLEINPGGQFSYYSDMCN